MVTIDPALLVSRTPSYTPLPRISPASSPVQPGSPFTVSFTSSV